MGDDELSVDDNVVSEAEYFSDSVEDDQPLSCSHGSLESLVQLKTMGWPMRKVLSSVEKTKEDKLKLNISGTMNLQFLSFQFLPVFCF